MYQGFSKDNGAVVGLVGNRSNMLDLSEAQETVGAEESLVGIDESGETISLISQLEATTGELTWVPTAQPQLLKWKTVAMSQMSSMLRDNDRNLVYEQAIKRIIEKFVQDNGRRPVVLDVGCGTGLLSLFAAKHGAQFTIGVEMFDELANISLEHLKENRQEDSIHIINAKSCDIDSLPMPADILISELLDSALLGECCIPSHSDAIERLMNKESESEVPLSPIVDRIIPNRAEVYATAVESMEIRSMVHIESISQGRAKFNLFRNEYASQCQGGWPQIPVHWQMLEERGSFKLSDAVPCLEINFFENVNESKQYEAGEEYVKTFDTDILIKHDGVVHGILLWWKTYLLSTNLDPLGSLFYSTEPGAQNWQNHWVQTVFPLPQPIPCNKGDILKLHVSHNELSIWLAAEKVQKQALGSGVKRTREEHVFTGLNRIIPKPVQSETFFQRNCSCGWHLLCGVDQLMRFNDSKPSFQWEIALDQLTNMLQSNENDTETKFILDYSDGSLLSLSLASKISKNELNLKVVSRETKFFSKLFFSQLVEANDFMEQLMIWDGQSIEEIIDYFYGNSLEDDEGMGQSDEMILPPMNIQFKALISDCHYYQLQQLPLRQAISFLYQRTMLHSFLHPECLILPSVASIMILPIELTRLRDSHGLITNVCGFSHQALDMRVQDWHKFYYPFRLGGFKKRPLAPPTVLTNLDYSQPWSQPINIISEIIMQTSGQLDAFAFWVDYRLDSDHNILKDWDGGDFRPYTTQNVKFIEVSQSVNLGDKVQIQSLLNWGDSDFTFDFNFIKQ